MKRAYNSSCFVFGVPPHLNRFSSFLAKKLRPNAILPKKFSEGAAGFDLFSSESAVVLPKNKCAVSTGLSVAIASGKYGRIAPRSGLAFKNFIDVGAGVIDSDYRGELKVLLFNFSNEDFKISPGDRVAQIIIENVVQTDIREVSELPPTKRGNEGFGSTGFHSNHMMAKRIPKELTREEVQIESVDSNHKELIATLAEVQQLKRELVAFKLIRLMERNRVSLEEKEALVRILLDENGTNEVFSLLEGSEMSEKDDLNERIKEFLGNSSVNNRQIKTRD